MPLPASLALEARLAGRAIPLGEAFDDEPSLEDKRAARRILDGVAATGLYALRAELPLVLELHYPTPADWGDFLARPKAAGLAVDQDLLADAEAALARGEGVLVAIERGTVGLYERTETPA